MRIPATFENAAALPDDFAPSPIGDRDTTIAQIKQIAPSANFSDPSWGTIDGDGWPIEINVGRNQECRGLTFHLRGRTTAAALVLRRIIDALGLRGLDTMTGEFLSPHQV